MNHIARGLGLDSLQFKEANLAQEGDSTSTSGKYHFSIPLPEMINEVDRACDFRRKHIEYQKPQTGRYRKGIGMALWFHEAGFRLGRAGPHQDQGGVQAAQIPRWHGGGSGPNGEIGQGLRTTFPKIVAHELNLPLEKVYYNRPDTARVPDSGPTVASRSLMVVGELLRRAAIKLRTQWKEGEDQIVEEHFREPDFMIPFYLDKFQGDAYPTYA